VHRRRRDAAAARSNLEAAAHQFASLGATAWSALTQADLLRLRVPSVATKLTPTETRVAVLAGRGHNNREIAAELFLSTRTVEGHLAATYRKLNVRGRADLARHPAVEH
jgi:DNA-binding NarL/FixJ family response regulator